MMPNSEPVAHRGLDPDLPTIAALAAAEVDELIHHRESEVHNLQRLAHFLTTSFENQRGHGGARRFLDPVSADVVASTLRDARQLPMSSYTELAQVSLQLAEQMRSAANAHADDLLPQLKRFCLALSRYALASKEGISSIGNAPDYKR
jgi:hypothetical protein